MKIILSLLTTITVFFLFTTPVTAVCGADSDCQQVLQYCEPDGSGSPTGSQFITGTNPYCDPSHPQANKEGCVYAYALPDRTNPFCCKSSTACRDVSYCQGDNTIEAKRGSCDINNSLHNANGCVYGSITVDPKNDLQCYKGVQHKTPPGVGNAFERVFGRINPPKELDPLILKGRDSSVGALSAFLRNIINVIYAASFIIFVFMIIIGGFEWLSSGGNKDKISGAQKRMTNALIGLTVLALVFFAATVLGKILGFNLLNINVAWP